MSRNPPPAPPPSPYFPVPYAPSPGSDFHPSPWTPLAIALVGVICTVFVVLSCQQMHRHFSALDAMITFPSTRPQSRRLNELDEPVSQQFRSHGLDPYATSSIPIVEFKIEDDKTECSVCLGEFEEGEALKQLPNCLHLFHVLCIDTWLLSHLSCPVCRAHVINDDYSVSVYSFEENLSREDLLQERSAMHQVLRSHVLHSSFLRGTVREN